VVVSKVSNGVKISIYANKPEEEENGVEDIQRLFEEKRLRSIIVVHRGHSFYVDQTIARISSIAKIVYLGSCGGFNNVSSVLERAPESRIITTKGKGTYMVNEPLLKNINESALLPELDWREVWEKTEKQISNKKDLSFYVPPYKNIATQLIRAYYDIR
jgi:hypothetical protein